MWRIRLFGPLAVEDGDVRLAKFETLRSAKLFALLALSRSGQMRRDDLCEMLWPEDFLDATRLRLRQELTRLRKALGPASEILEAGSDLVKINRTRCETDLELLRRATALPSDSPLRSDRLQQAVALAQEQLLGGWDDVWVLAERGAAQTLLGQARCALAELLLAENALEEALTVGNDAIKSNPCDESASAIVVKAHAALGSMTDAMVEFQRLKRELRAQLNLEPSEQLIALMDRLEERSSAGPILHGRELPAPVDTFFGRENELAEIGTKIKGSDRLITLVGPGGIGKSRLAIESVRLSAGLSAVFVPLAETEDASSITSRIVESFGERASNSEPLTYLAQQLRETKALAILDNLEHLMPAAAGEVKRILEACPNLKVVATSRSPLQIAGERVITVGPLEASTGATEMLLELWQSVRPSLKLDDEARRQATLLATELDGYPLAIRLAATKLKLRSPSDIIRDLGALTGSAPDLAERHRSLDETLAWSFATLAPDAQELLTQLSFFRGGCRLDAAEEIVPGVGLAAIEACLDASLLILDESRSRLRVKMLEPVRQFLARNADREMLATGEDRFVTWAGAFIEGLLPGPYFTPRKVAVFAEIDDELDNILGAWKLLLARGPAVALRALRKFWIYEATRGRQRELLARLEEAWSGYDELSDEDKIEVLIGKVSSLSVRKRNAECRESLLELRDLGERTGSRENLISVDQSLLSLDSHLYSFEERLAKCDVLIEKALELGTPMVIGYIYSHRGSIFQQESDHVLAKDSYELAVRYLSEAGDDIGTTRNSQMLALQMSDLGLDDSAILNRVREQTHRLGDPFQLSGLAKLDGLRLERQGRWAEALVHFNEAISIWNRLSCPERVREIQPSSVRCLLELGRLDEARAMMIEAAAGLIAANERSELAILLTRAAHYHLLLRDKETARRALGAAAALNRKARVKPVTREQIYTDRLRAEIGGDIPSDQVVHLADTRTYFEAPIIPLAMAE